MVNSVWIFRGILLLTCVLGCLTSTFPSLWFLMHAPPSSLCDTVPANTRQRRLCKKHPDMMMGVSSGVRKAMRECQHQFRHHRWNCSGDESAISRIHQQASREASFLQSITAAAVTHAVAEYCAKGLTDACSCDHRKRPGLFNDDGENQFTWSGCSHDVDTGSQYARNFLDIGGSAARDPRALMNKHNGRAGRKAVKQFTKLMCKCHGWSGSCAMKLCWVVVGPFRRAGAFLKTKYNQAIQVTMHQGGMKLIPQEKKTKQRRQELVYLEDSPDYCQPNPLIGAMGTAGRQCFKTKTGSENSCDVLCCGRGYDTVTARWEEECNCKFIWCCDVICQKCSRVEDRHLCKGYGRRRAKTYST